MIQLQRNVNDKVYIILNTMRRGHPCERCAKFPFLSTTHITNLKGTTHCAMQRLSMAFSIL